MIYIAASNSHDGIAKVRYESKDGKASKAFDAQDWLAQLTTHIPEPWRADITDFTRIGRVDYEKWPAPMMKSRH